MARNRTSPLQTELPLDQSALEQSRLRRAARRALDRRRERQQAKALALQLALVEEERRTEDYLRRQAEVRERLERDPRLDALLAFRRRGKPVAEALAEVEQRFGEARFSDRVERSAASPRGAHRGGCGTL
jgi:hypothetical protein